MSPPSPSSKDLVRRTLRGEPTPRIPLGPLAVHFCARFSGVSLRKYSLDAGLLADAVLRYYERFRPDAVWISADTWVGAEAMGATVGSDDDEQPLGGLGSPLILEPRDVDRLPAPDPHTQGRYALMLEAVRRVVDRIGRDVFVVACFDQYPFSLAAALMGLQPILLRAVDDPPMVEALMQRCEAFTLAYGKALADAGADLLSGGDSPAALLGPSRYRELAQPVERRVIDALRRHTGKPVSLHLCGDTRRILPDLAATGADVLELDHQVPLGVACRTVGPQVALWGNLDPVGVLAQGTPDDVRAAARSALEEVRAAGHRRFVLSSGCTLAVETPPENLDALSDAVRACS